MPLEPSVNSTERILVYGNTGSGKSNAILTVAKRCPDANFYVIDNDLGITPIIENEMPELSADNGGNVHVYFCDSFDEHMDALAEIQEKAKAGDWLVIDMLGSMWGLAQERFSDIVYGKGLDQHLMDAAIRAEKDDDGSPPFDGMRDWPSITQTHAKVYREMLKASINKKMNLYCTAASAELMDDRGKIKESKANKETYGGIGWKPKGQKEMGHKFNTILMFEKKGIGKWYMTGVKDRGRESFEREEFTDFAKDYLVKKAKWNAVVKKKVDDADSTN